MRQENGDRLEVDCENCLGFSVSRSMLAMLEKGEFSPWQRAIISHTIRRTGAHPLVTTSFADTVLANAGLASASELLDNLLLHISGELGRLVR